MPRKPEDRINQIMNRMVDDPPFKSGRIYNMEIKESQEVPGKFELSLDGIRMPGDFDTEHEAMMFMAGLLIGESGILEKVLDGSVQTRKVEFYSGHAS
jgi:hypothetical protein